jgi:hypothetical protein
MVGRWDEIRETDYDNDFEKAVFFRTERANYVRGQAGDQQFRADINANLLGISGQRGFDYIKVLRAFPRRVSWVKLGGFRSLFFLTGLTATTRQRQRVLRLASNKADAQGNSVTNNMVKEIAKAQGLVSSRGRPGSTQLEQQRRILAQYIYDKTQEGETIPDRVQRAMPHDLAAQFV